MNQALDILYLYAQRKVVKREKKDERKDERMRRWVDLWKKKGLKDGWFFQSFLSVLFLVVEEFFGFGSGGLFGRSVFFIELVG